MKRRAEIVTLKHAQRSSAFVERATHPGLYLTPEVIEAIGETIGTHTPESGGKLFGPAQRSGADVFEFDLRGSAGASRSVYAPDEVWGAFRESYWMDRAESDQRVQHGDVHSHPGRDGRPSTAVGDGLGDLGYAASMLRGNEWMAEYAIPIVTIVRRRALIWPWVVTREEPNRPLFVDVHICAATEFPDRMFNPAWRERLDAQAQAAEDQLPVVAPTASGFPLMEIDLSYVADRVNMTLTIEGSEYRFGTPEAELCLRFTDRPAQDGPSLSVCFEDGTREPFHFSWRRHHVGSYEYRLIRLLRHVRTQVRLRF